MSNKSMYLQCKFLNQNKRNTFFFTFYILKMQKKTLQLHDFAGSFSQNVQKNKGGIIALNTVVVKLIYILFLYTVQTQPVESIYRTSILLTPPP